MQNDLLNRIAEELMKNLPSGKDRVAVERILSGAVKILYGTPEAAKQTEEFVKTATSVEQLVEGVVSTLLVLHKKSNGTMPWGPAIAAGQILLLEALAEVSDTGAIQITEKTVADATKMFIESVLRTIGVSTEQLIDVAKKAGAVSKAGVPGMAGGGV